MRLGTRLILAFLAVALIPAGAILAFTWFSVEQRFQDELRIRLEGVTQGIQTNIEQIGESLERKVGELTQSDDVERILVQMVRGKLDRRALIPEAARWMKAWDLDLLSILDGMGTVLSSGHLPARYGSKDEKTLELVSSRILKPVMRSVQVLRSGRIETVLAVVVVGKRSFDDAEVIILGGKLLDAEFITYLEDLSGALIQIVDDQDNVVVGQSGRDEEEKPLWETREDVTYKRIALPPGGKGEASLFIAAGVSGLELEEARERILIASAAAAVAGVLISLLLGLLISRRILQPVEALVFGARRIARGDLQHRLEEKYSGEVGELVRTFNTMVADLSVARKRLIRAERVAAWQEIARRIAHEIKNPLSPIQMSIETLRKAYLAKHPEFNEIFEESTRAILEEVEALKRIVSEFSEFARMPKPTLVAQDLNDVVASTVSLYSNEAGGERIVFVPGENLPRVQIDREQIGRVVGNLLSNALWATRAGGGVEVDTHGDGERVILVVADKGQGMLPDVQEKVFTPYFTTRRDGTGLGLAIVQRIVEDHGAAIEIESVQERGTRVIISFPVDS